MNSAPATDLPCPSQLFWKEAPEGGDIVEVHCAGRDGWRAADVGVKVSIPAPELNAPCGSMSWWLLPREDFATSSATPWMQEKAPAHPTYVIFSDAEKSAHRNRNAVAPSQLRWKDRFFTNAMTTFRGCWPSIYRINSSRAWRSSWA